MVKTFFCTRYKNTKGRKLYTSTIHVQSPKTGTDVQGNHYLQLHDAHDGNNMMHTMVTEFAL